METEQEILQISEAEDYEIGRLMFGMLDELCLADLFRYDGMGSIVFISDENIRITMDTYGETFGEPGTYVSLWDDIYRCETLAEALINLIDTLFDNIE